MRRENISLCLHCGQPKFLELFEMWGDREFQIETCCFALHEEVVSLMNDDPRSGAELLNALQAGEIVGVGHQGARRVVDNGCGQLVIDWNLEIDPDLPFAQVKAFVAEHHRHCPSPRGWRFGAGIRNGHDLVGVIVVGRPVARGFDSDVVVEVNRLCVRDDIPPGLVWNACSMLYGWAARQAKRRGFSRIVTYTLQSEEGTTLRAAGWSEETRIKGRSWNTASRPRDDKSPTVDKVRWGRALKPVGLASRDQQHQHQSA